MFNMVLGWIWSATAVCKVFIVNAPFHMISSEVGSVWLKPLTATLCCSVTVKLVVQRLVNDWVKTVGRLQMIEGRTYFLTRITFILIWMKINRKYFFIFHSFSEPQYLSSLLPSFQLYSSTLGCAYLYLTARAAWIEMMQIQYLFLSEPRQTVHYFVVLYYTTHTTKPLQLDSFATVVVLAFPGHCTSMSYCAVLKPLEFCKQLPMNARHMWSLSHLRWDKKWRLNIMRGSDVCVNVFLIMFQGKFFADTFSIGRTSVM